jgi:hypothetical protein
MHLLLIVSHFLVPAVLLRLMITSCRCCVAVLGATAFVGGRVYAVSAGGFSLPTIAKSFLGNLKDLLTPKTLVSE